MFENEIGKEYENGEEEWDVIYRFCRNWINGGITVGAKSCDQIQSFHELCLSSLLVLLPKAGLTTVRLIAVGLKIDKLDWLEKFSSL